MSNERTCVVCRKKAEKSFLYRFILLNDEIVIDLKHRIYSYGYYFCRDKENCHGSIAKWFKRKNKKVIRC